VRRPIFVTPLSAEEFHTLQELWYASKPLEQMRIRIVLESNEGYTAAEIAQRTGWTPRAVRRVIQRYNLGGLSSLSDRRRTNPGRRRIVTDEWQGLLLAMIEQPPATYGFPADRWTAKLLAACLAQTNHVYVGEERVRHYLRRNGYSFANRRWSRPALPGSVVFAETALDSAFDDGQALSFAGPVRQNADEDAGV
jgi:transposase